MDTTQGNIIIALLIAIILLLWTRITIKERIQTETEGGEHANQQTPASAKEIRLHQTGS